MEYFGTNLTDYGHYRWSLVDGTMLKNWKGFNDLPFHPENLTNNLPNGEVTFYQGGGYTAVAITGSPKDERPGSKSVFWVKEIIEKGELIKRILDNEAAKKIIEAMLKRFPIQW